MITDYSLYSLQILKKTSYWNPCKKRGNELCFVANWARFMLLEERFWWDFKAVKSWDRLLGSVQSLRYCKDLRAIGEMLIRHDKGRANPVAWKWDELGLGVCVFYFYCFWAWNKKANISKVFHVDLYPFPLKSIYISLLMSVGVELNQFRESQPY